MQRRTFLLCVSGLAMATLGAAEPLSGKIYLVRAEGAHRCIYCLDPNTGKSRRLMRGERQETAPRLSPNGSSLLFACADLEADWHIRKLDLASGKETPLVESSSWPVCWVDERRFIANIDTQYWLCQADGVRLRKVADSGGGPVFGCMAPNGDFFYTIYGEPSQLAAMNLEGGVVRKLGPGSNPISAAGRILYQGKDGYLQTRVSGGPATTVSNLKGVSEAVFSPDGRYLAWLHPASKGSRLVLATLEYQVVRSYLVGPADELFWGV